MNNQHAGFSQTLAEQHRTRLQEQATHQWPLRAAHRRTSTNSAAPEAREPCLRSVRRTSDSSAPMPGQIVMGVRGVRWTAAGSRRGSP
jgi:hypothetical protein